MKVRYLADMRYPFPPGKEHIEQEMEVDDLPPLAQRAIEKDGLDSVMQGWFLWEHLGMTIWWAVRPCVS